MFNAIKRKIFGFDIVALFIILSVFYFKDFFLSCTNYFNLSFDSQIPLTWDFTAMSNLFPYKDIYFPYGILFYFKNNSPFLSAIYFFLPTIMFIGIYIILKKISGSKLLGLTSFITFYLFIYKYTGVENFTRYGIILSIASLFSYVFHKARVISLKTSFLLGVLMGIIFSLVNDQGLYSYVLFISLLVTTPILIKSEKLNYFKYLFSRTTANIFGLVLGISPFFIFLKNNNLIGNFLLFVKNLSDFPLYAKTPFIPFSTTIDNLFTFVILFVVIVYLSYKIFISKKKLVLINFFEISIVLVLVMLEQKSIIRSIDKQITFISFLLYIVIFYEFIKSRIPNLYIIICFIVFSVPILSGIGLHPFINYKLNFDHNLLSSLSNKNMSAFLLDKSRFCLDDNLNRLINNKDTKFEKVKRIIEKDTNGSVSIFDYLSDPVFYVLFKQKPPYYFTIFEATPLYAQESNIKYIEQNKVNYVIYNENIQAIEDGVPNHIRNRLISKYVMNNFRVLEKLDNFTIYKKK